MRSRIQSFIAALRLRSLRVQVLLWTIAPLTILLIIFSLTGIGSHQVSMRTLAAEENGRLGLLMADAVAMRAGGVAASLEATAQLLAHHVEMQAMRQAHVADASRVLGGLELVLADQDGRVVEAAPRIPAWAEAVPDLLADSSSVLANTPALAADGSTLLWRVAVPGSRYWLLAGAPLAHLDLARVTSVAQGAHPATVALVDATGHLLYASGADAVPALTVAAAQPVDEVATRFERHNGQEFVTTVAPVPGTTWRLVLSEPWHGMAGPMLRFEEAMPAVLLIAVAVSLLTLLFGLLFVVRPLRDLGERTRQIGRGDYSAVGSRVGGVEEIEELRLSVDQMAQQVQSSQAGLQQYLHAVTRAQEDERARLARELHDETVQTLIALDHKAQKVQRELVRDPERLPEQIAELRRMAAGATAEVRRFSRALRPLYLEDLGLAPALELLASEAGAGYTLVGSPQRLHPDTELALYRIAQESLSNARRHAEAQEIEVTLAFQPDQVRLTICDDGRGFVLPANLADLTSRGHYGLMSIHERAQLAGAQLEIRSAEGEGTEVMAVVREGRTIEGLGDWVIG